MQKLKTNQELLEKLDKKQEKCIKIVCETSQIVPQNDLILINLLSNE